MTRVLLINPPQTYNKKDQDFSVYFPIGLMYLAAMVNDICHVEIFDCLTIGFETKKGNLVTYGAPPELIRKMST